MLRAVRHAMALARILHGCGDSGQAVEVRGGPCRPATRQRKAQKPRTLKIKAINLHGRALPQAKDDLHKDSESEHSPSGIMEE